MQPRAETYLRENLQLKVYGPELLLINLAKFVEHKFRDYNSFKEVYRSVNHYKINNFI